MSKYEFIKIEDKPTLTKNYVGEIVPTGKHSKAHFFNLSDESRQKLIDIVYEYGITKNDFTEKDQEEHPFFYDIICNNLQMGNELVHYYYSKELEYLDKSNLPLENEMYHNGILLYGKDDIMSVNRVYRLTEKIENEKGYNHETIEEFKQFFLSKRQGHDFKKDLEDILNAEDNAVEYGTTSEGEFYSRNLEENIIAPMTIWAKSPRMDFILNRTSLSEESKNKFKKYTDLRDFVMKYRGVYKYDKTFTLDELKEFFKAVDKIDNEYMLHYDLMDKIEELKENLGI